MGVVASSVGSVGPDPNAPSTDYRGRNYVITFIDPTAASVTVAATDVEITPQHDLKLYRRNELVGVVSNWASCLREDYIPAVTP